MIKKCCIGLLLLALWGCAPSRDFNAERQKGAHISENFPRFSDRPEAETSQFTQEASQNLTEELTNEVQKLRQQGHQTPSAQKNIAAKAQRLAEEVEETLRHIEQGATKSQP